MRKKRCLSLRLIFTVKQLNAMSASLCPIGTAGEKWGPAEFAAWKELHSVKRSYDEEVLGEY